MQDPHLSYQAINSTSARHESTEMRSQRTRVASAGVTTTAPSNAISSSAASIRPAPAFAPPARPANATHVKARMLQATLNLTLITVYA